MFDPAEEFVLFVMKL